MTNRARDYQAALRQIPKEHRDAITRYVRTIRRTQQNTQQPTRPEFTNALLETIQACEKGSTINQLTTIATRHNLTAQEHANLGQALWHAAQQGLLPESGARDRTPPYAREHHHTETETQE